MPQLVGNSLGLTGLRSPGAGGGRAGGPFPVNAVHFDGTNDNLTRGAGLTGAADGEDLLLSIWVNMTGQDDETHHIISNVNNNFIFTRLLDNKFQFSVRSPAPATIWDVSTDTLYSTTDNPGWHHILIAAQLDGTPVGQVYVDDVEAAVTEATAPTNGDIDFTTTNHAIGGTVAGGFRLEGDLAEVYLTNEYLDISSEANRRLFIDSNQFPVDLGSDGSTPTGTAALLFFSGATATWHTNDGTGGGYTETGALTDASTSPSD